MVHDRTGWDQGIQPETHGRVTSGALGADQISGILVAEGIPMSLNVILLVVLGIVVIFTIVSVIAMFTEMNTKKKSGKMKGNTHNQAKKRKK